MAGLEELPGIEAFMREKIVGERKSHKDISRELQLLHPGMLSGLSSMSVRRYCSRHGIHKTSGLDDRTLDHLVEENVAQVGPCYGRKTMTGLLASQGYRVAQSRVGSSLSRVCPVNHMRRVTQTERQTNPVPYTARYFGEKVHIDQNEKLVMFGVTHICAIDGFSGKIVAFCSMPIKNNIAVYENIFVKMVENFGLWDQIRVDCGSEWNLMLFTQEKLAHLRNDSTKPPHLRSSSRNNHIVERIWVEVNARVNYPIKETLIRMLDQGDISTDDQQCCFCISWFTLRVANIGLNLLVSSWNEHPIPNHRSGMPRGVPNQRMLMDNRARKIDNRNLPLSIHAVQMYEDNGGHITEESNFGTDPLAGDPEKITIRDRAFSEKYPSFEPVFHQIVNGNDRLFQAGLKFFIDVTFRLSVS